MATNTLPETVLGIDLFIPSAHNYFSVDSGGLPNGDSCLVVHGDVSRNYKAFIQAPVLSPDVFLNRINSTGTWSMSFWFKGSNITYSTVANSQVLFGVMTSRFTETGVLPRGGSVDWMWSISATTGTAGTSNPIRFRKPRCYGGGSPSYAEWSGFASPPPDKWIFVVIEQTVSSASSSSGGGAPCFIWTRAEDQVTETSNSCSAGSIGSAASNLPNYADEQYFCIGAYSSESPIQSRDGEWRLGKLAFHDHILSLTERAMLFNSMVGVF